MNLGNATITVKRFVDLSSTLNLVQWTVLSNLTPRWTDNV